MHFLITITLCLFLAFVFTELSYRLRIPLVVGQIIAGIVIGIPLVTQHFIADNTEVVGLLSDLGIIFLLFLA
ncbi:cation:proton antiporter, partial [Candidatus Woesearchaeota archaeon]|nr:cation:proton antiporter [Candidatus Woesearchaeota archaeon]